VIHRGIPVAPPARVIMDLAGKLPLAGRRRAVNEALNRGQVKVSDLVTRRHRGAAKLRKIIATAAPTRNEYEDIVLAVLHQGDLPTPDVNVRRGRFIPDFRRPEHRVILEADSRKYHDHLLARADDARRQAFLEAQGEIVLRTTWREVVTRPAVVVARVRAALVERQLDRALHDEVDVRRAA
jgi:very-short-patch-repair endonuclease